MPASLTAPFRKNAAVASAGNVGNKMAKTVSYNLAKVRGA